MFSTLSASLLTPWCASLEVCVAVCTPTLLWCKKEERKLQRELRLGLAWDSRLIKVQEAAGWGCPCGVNCWLKLELLAKVADSEAGPETAMQCGQDGRSESRARRSAQAGNDPYEKKQPWTVWLLVLLYTEYEVCETMEQKKSWKKLNWTNENEYYFTIFTALKHVTFCYLWTEPG